MAIKERLERDLATAQKAKHETAVSTLRLLLAAIHNAEIAKRTSLTDAELLPIISREMKRRREAISGYEQAGRNESADKERLELSILETYAPKPLTEAELRTLIEQTIAEIGRDHPGKLMGAVIQAAKGQADGQTVRRLVEEITQGSRSSD